jgi:hypothetical protein
MIRQFVLAALLISNSFAIAFAGGDCVAFDVNPLVVAREVTQPGLLSHLPNSRQVEIQLDVSALFSPGKDSQITEYTVRVMSRHDDVQVADYSPRTEMISDVVGPMQITQDADRNREGAIKGVGGYPGVGTVYGYAYGHDRNHETVAFAKRPSMELATASGTLARRKGVYFKVKQSSQYTLEGARPFRIVFEVPKEWRADLLDVAIEAVGIDSASSKRPRVLSVHRFVVAAYLEFDDSAAQAATNYMRQQRRLSNFARNYATTIEQRSFPTPLHKLGAKLDMYEPNIPQDWFEAVVHQPGTGYPILKLSYLPVDLRVEILNYLDHKELIESLSGTADASRVAKQPTPQFATR